MKRRSEAASRTPKITNYHIFGRGFILSFAPFATPHARQSLVSAGNDDGQVDGSCALWSRAGRIDPDQFSAPASDADQIGVQGSRTGRRNGSNIGKRALRNAARKEGMSS